jgi:hypothetical protein
MGITQVLLIKLCLRFCTFFFTDHACQKKSLQCNIAHALEKTKYPDSDIYWKKFDEKYHFSCQFTADIIAMNNADFIITSTYQEIAGRYFLFWLIDHIILSVISALVN